MSVTAPGQLPCGEMQVQNLKWSLKSHASEVDELLVVMQKSKVGKCMFDVKVTDHPQP